MWTQVTYTPFAKLTGIDGTKITININRIVYVERNEQYTKIVLDNRLKTTIKVKEDYDEINSLLSGK